jgi:GTP-binding protein Era
LTTRAGFVALAGLPNAGKSTLLNRVLGEKVSITSSKPQTTRRRLAGIWSHGETQIVFVDTPGLLEPTYPLQRALADEVAASLDGVDLICLMRDASISALRHRQTDDRGRAKTPAPLDLEPREHALLRTAATVPVFLILNKTDLLGSDLVESAIASAAEDARFSEVHAVSATTGAGVETLLDAVLKRLPESPFYFDPDELTDRPLRFLVAELVRETLYETLEQELPYACHVEVTEYLEDRAIPRIEAVIWVERESQKGIVIGRGGATLKKIGIRSREKIEGLAGGQVFLQLTAKVRPNWRKREADLKRFGYRT